VGRLAWDQSAKTLTISGKVFIDGNLSVINVDSAVYSGSGTIYVNGTIGFDNSGSICGPPSTLLGTGGCSGDWDPSVGALLLVACNAANVVPAFSMSGNSLTRVEAGVFAVGRYDGTNGAAITGPVIASYGNLQGDPSFKPFAFLPAGAPGNPGNALGTPYDYR
jgi:hypothetical protein